MLRQPPPWYTQEQRVEFVKRFELALARLKQKYGEEIPEKSIYSAYGGLVSSFNNGRVNNRKWGLSYMAKMESKARWRKVAESGMTRSQEVYRNLVLQKREKERREAERALKERIARRGAANDRSFLEY